MHIYNKVIISLSWLFFLINEGVAPPPRHVEQKEEKPQETGLEDLGIEYERYLKEVIDVLESDPEFKRKLEAAEETDIRTGKIAHELEYVDHNVRSKLDEVKRQELERLRHLANREYEISNDIDVDHMKIAPPAHLDHENPHTFEIDDLKKLIAKVTSDLNEADKQRREEFKEYEMQKEFEKQEKLKHLEGSEKEAFEKQLKDNETKHKQHDPLHHPGSKQQLEEVWEKQDHMENQEFNPKVFFQLHDLDGNGFWDQTEVKTLFLKELDKMYQMGAPEDDMRERAEEMERMREHVFREADKNKDQLISYQEFLDQTKQPEFDKNPGWETVDQRPAYTHDEYVEFERRRQQEIQRMIQQGLIPPQPVYNVPPGYHHPQMQQFPQGHHPGQPQYAQHPGQHPQQFQQGHPNQLHGAPNVQGHPQQFAVPQGQAHPSQYQNAQAQPNMQGHPNQFQNVQGHPNQFPNSQPNQVQGHPNQFPNDHQNQFQGHPNAQQNQFQGHSNQFPNAQQNQFQGHPNQYPNAQQNQFQGHPSQLPNAQPNHNQNIPTGNVNSQPNQFQGHGGQPSDSQHNAAAPQGQPNSPQGQPIPQNLPPSNVPAQGHDNAIPVAGQPNSLPDPNSIQTDNKHGSSKDNFNGLNSDFQKTADKTVKGR